MYKKLSGMTVQVRLRKKNSMKSTTFVLFQSQPTVPRFNVLTIQTFFVQAIEAKFKAVVEDD